MEAFLFWARRVRACVLVATTALGFGLTLAHAKPRFVSGPASVPLIELFTSEGCSSCPPAERWLGDLRDAPGLWREFVPVAWHVDYWNRLGWPDRFSKKDHTQRQYALAAAWGSRSVYTPCFVRNGEEWHVRGATPERAADAKPAGRLVASQLNETTERWRVDYTTPPGDRSDFTLHVAVLGGGFASNVTAGENRGATLRQEFVALATSEYPLARTDDNTSRWVEFEQPKPTLTDAKRHALALWVTRRGELTPLQATGGWLN